MFAAPLAKNARMFSGTQFQCEETMTGLSADGMILCEDEKRSGVLRNPLHPLNGIDFVEFRRVPGHPTLDVTFLKPPPVPPAIGPINFALIGGVS